MAGLPSCSNGAEHINQFPWSNLPRLYEITTAKDSVKRCSCTFKGCKRIIAGLFVNGKASYCTMPICSGGSSNELQKEVFAAHHKLLEYCLKESTNKKTWRIKNFHFRQSLLFPESTHVPSYIHNEELAKDIYGKWEERYRVGPEYPHTWFVVPTERTNNTGETNVIPPEQNNTKVCSHNIGTNCCSPLVGKNLFLPPPSPAEDFLRLLPQLYERTMLASPTCSCLKSADCGKCMTALIQDQSELNHCSMKIRSGGTGSKAQKKISSKHQELLFYLLLGEGISPKNKTLSTWIIKSIHFHPLVRESDSGSVQSYIHNQELAQHIYGEKEGLYQVGDSYSDTWFVLPTQFVASSKYKGTSALSLQSLKTTIKEEKVKQYQVDDCTLKSLHADITTAPDRKVRDDIFEANQTFVVSDNEDDDTNGERKTMPQKKADELRGHLISLVKNAYSTLPGSTPKSIEYLENHRYTNDNPSDYKRTSAFRLDECILLIARATSHVLLPNSDPDDALFYFSQALAGKMAKHNKEEKESANEDVICTKIGKHVAEIISAKSGVTFQKCIKRRPLMSICTLVTSREKMQNLMQVHISKYEWEQARAHCIFPGAGEPAEKKNASRIVVPNETLITFTTWLKQNGYIQDLDYGHKVITYKNGRQVPIAGVKIAAATRISIIRDYFSDIVEKVAQSVHPEWYLTPDEDCPLCDCTNDNNNPSESSCCLLLNHEGPHMFRCKTRCPKINVRCLKEHGHQGQHKYTPSTEALSFTSADLIIKKITSGKMTSLAGLDDIDTCKGTENFQKMRSMVNILSQIAGMHVYESDTNRISQLHQDINDTELYHKVEFARHLDLKLERDSKHICTCVRCGFSLDGENIEPCPLHEAGEHIGPCDKCQKSFEIISELYNLFESARTAVHKRSSEEQDLKLNDDLDRWEDELAEVRRDLEDYRAHLVFKYDERFVMQFSNFLAEVEAELGFDFKMKMLEAYHRECKKMYYSKRGISNLGYTVATKSKVDTTKICTEHHMFLSNYTTQSADFSNRAKEVLYKDILKPRGLDSIVAVFDGGGHFRGNESKAFMAISDEMTGVHEDRLVQFPPGDGKDKCDRLFALLGHHMRRLQNAGNSWRGAHDIVRLLIIHPLPNNIFVHHFEPDFSTPLLQIPDSAKLAGYYNVKNDPKKGGVIAKVHSRHSVGDFFPYSEIMPQKTDVAPSPATTTKKIRHSDNAEEDTTMADRIKAFSKHSDQRPPQESSIYDGVDLQEAATYFDYLDQFDEYFEDPNLPSSIKMSNYPFQDKEYIRNNKEYSPLPGQVRAITAMRDKIAKREKIFMKKEESMRNQLSCRGLHKCTKQDIFGSFCSDYFLTKEKLDKHMKEGEHTFPFEDISSRATATVLAGQSELQIDLDKVVNRSDAHAQSNLPVIMSPKSKFNDERIGLDWYKRGCFSPKNKRGREGSKRKSYAMLCDLELIHLAGDSRSSDSAKPSANKFKPNEAATYLSNLLDEEGRRKYRRNGKYGNLLKAEQIKAWMGGRYSGRIAPIILGKDEFENYSISELKEECTARGLSPAKKWQVFEIIELYDNLLIKAMPAIAMTVNKEAAKAAISMLKENRLSFAKYSANSTKVQLKAIFTDKKVPYYEPGTKKSLLLLLRMDRLKRKDGPPRPPPVKVQITAMHTSITSTNEAAAEIKADECKNGEDSDSDLSDIDIDIDNDIFSADDSIDDSASVKSKIHSHSINKSISDGEIEEESAASYGDDDSFSSFDSENYASSSDSSDEVSFDNCNDNDAGQDETNALFEFEDIANLSRVSEHSSNESAHQSPEKTLISNSESDSESKSYSSETRCSLPKPVSRKADLLPALNVLATHPAKHSFDGHIFDTVTTTLNCKSCQNISDICMILICSDAYYDHCQYRKQLLWETMSLYAFGLLQLHQAHRTDIFLVDCSTPQQDTIPATVMKSKEVKTVVTIAHGKNHFVILSFDLQTKIVSVYDGLGYELNTWDDHYSFIFSKIGEREGKKWKKMYAKSLRGRKVMQNDGWNCGPIACMVLWGIINPSKEYDDLWDRGVHTFRNTVTEKMKVLINQSRNALEVERTARWICRNIATTAGRIEVNKSPKKATRLNTKPCSCKKGCSKNRCGCLKNNQICGEKCNCKGLCGM